MSLIFCAVLIGLGIAALFTVSSLRKAKDGSEDGGGFHGIGAL